MKRVPPAVVILFGVVAAVVCVRFGLWQLSRLEQKQKWNADVRAALAAPPRPLPAAVSPPAESLHVHRWSVSGRFDTSRQVLLLGRARQGEPGVHVVTPLLPDDGGPAVLVNRGWLPSFDGFSARVDTVPEPGPRTVVGLADPLGRPERFRGAYREARVDSIRVWTAMALDVDSLRARFPYPLREVVLRELPGPGVPARPIRPEPRPLDEMVHRSYAMQWFSFALISLLGPWFLVRAQRRRQDAPGPPAED